jgi:hypothetical protein
LRAIPRRILEAMRGPRMFAGMGAGCFCAGAPAITY